MGKTIGQPVESKSSKLCGMLSFLRRTQKFCTAVSSMAGSGV
jgi:hypothetical protein